MSNFLTLSILGLVEGLTEFVPVSSSGHLILARDILGAVGPMSLGIDAVLQVGAVLALVVYFFKDLLGLLYTFFYLVTGRPVKAEDRALFWAVIVGTIPGVILGLLLEKTMDTVFRDAHLVAYALIAGSAVMFFSEWVSKRKATLAQDVGVKKGFLIGLFQALALVPGMSRSGMTIAGGLYLGLTREAAARFGFILSIPILLGSGAKKFIELSQAGTLAGLGGPILLGTLVAFLSGLAVIHLLLKFLKTQPLYVFVVYRVLLAIAILVFI